MKPMHRSSRALAALALLMLAAPSTGASQAAPTVRHADAPVANAAPLQGSIDLDGRLTEGAWAGATPVTSFTQLDPEEGEPASERTEVYILYDADALYVGARLYDRSPV